MKPGEFHWTDGWFFSRLDDGSVHIEKRDNPGPDDKTDVALTIPPMEWASIVVHCAGTGAFDQADAYRTFQKFHGITP